MNMTNWGKIIWDGIIYSVAAVIVAIILMYFLFILGGPAPAVFTAGIALAIIIGFGISYAKNKQGLKA